jgi:hypothetical protein
MIQHLIIYIQSNLGFNPAHLTILHHETSTDPVLVQETNSKSMQFAAAYIRLPST